MEKCSSPHIIRYLDYYESKMCLYIVMEYCAGGNLKDFISQKDAPLKPIVAQNFAIQIKEALITMKSNDIVHRDLKPENIVLSEATEKAIIKVTDFGTARFKTYDQNDKTVLQTYAGTPSYMAPEIQSKDGVNDHQIYNSTGSVLIYFSSSLFH